jgi:NAD(P)-dependent dehydrogenase (short-subunit alcohol dehydrogenase family)
MTTTSLTALITGASAGLGRALATALAERGWTLVLDARGADRLAEVAVELGRITTVEAVAGSVADPAHRAELTAAVRWHGSLDLLVHNASELGGSPQPALADLDPHTLRTVLDINVVAPLALTRELLPDLVAARGVVIAVSSDAAVEHYEGWGAYGASKAALDHLTAVLATEHPDLRVYAVDPGDMATDMHQAAFPGEDISDRPAPETVVPGLLALIDGDLPSGRYRAAELVPVPKTAAAR